MYHESQHADVAIKIGAKVRYLMTLWNEGDRIAYQVGTQPYGAHISKIGLAAITAYPDPPSRGDIIDILNMGYSGIQDVGREN